MGKGYLEQFVKRTLRIPVISSQKAASGAFSDDHIYINETAPLKNISFDINVLMTIIVKN